MIIPFVVSGRLMSRRGALRILAVIPFVSPRRSNAARNDTHGVVRPSHLGQHKKPGCGEKTHERVRALMEGKTQPRRDAKPASGNLGCE
jgi:hypothetical protein